MEEDEARTKATAVAEKEEAIAKHQAIIQRVVDINESSGRDEEVIRAYANRPDLRSSSKYPVAASEEIEDLE
jgi:hypothetical protein